MNELEGIHSQHNACCYREKCRQVANKVAELEKQLAQQQDFIADWEKQSEPAYWVLKTGHGTKFVEVKPYCEVDYWKPLYTHPAELTDEDLDKLIKDAEQAGYMEMYIVGLIDGFNRAREILRKAKDK